MVPNVPIATAQRGIFEERISAQGRVGPPAGSSARIAFAGSGIVRSIEVRVGEAVEAGAPLAELDVAPLDAAVAQARADVEAAQAGYAGGTVPQASLANARARYALAETHVRTLERSGVAASSDFITAQSVVRQAELKVSSDRQALDRAQTLVAGGVAPAKDVEAARRQLEGDTADDRAAEARLALASGDRPAALQQARADLASARNDLAAARAQGGTLGAQLAGAAARLRSAEINAGNGVLRAPAAGVVWQVLHRPGEAVDPSQPVIELGPPDDREATLTVPADRAGTIAVGDAVRFAFPFADDSAGGRIIAVVPAVDPAAQTATIVASGVPPHAIAGAALSAVIDVAARAGIVVPATALVEDPQTGGDVVFVEHRDAKGRTFEQRSVRVAASDERTALIVAGLRAGERIASKGGYELLAPPGG
jgi:multidrug resistance efflux pump